MTKSCPSIRVLVIGALLLALVAIATPAAADPASASTLEITFFAGGPPGDVNAQCEWWYTWC